MTTQSILTVNDLHVHVSTEHCQVPILNGVSFDLQAGKVFGLVGESGSGKTMTCLALVNLLPNKSKVVRGSIVLKNKDLRNISASEMRQIRGKEIAMIMQNPMSAFNPVVTIGQHFRETLRIHLQVTQKQAEEMAIAYLELMQLPRPDLLLKQYPFQLSGGMLQRVMIAIAVSLQPSIIIADEPTTALDATNQLQILDQLNWLRKEYNTSILLVSHDLGAIAYLADEVAVMNSGNIVERASVSTLFNRPTHPYTKALLESRLSLSRKACETLE
ncbi:ABC transporter ATP-binding protein [Brevibacillus porteri]|uniref:ABC transporter ATP-binding protein n=1 Tax=Brevibacillus porteri TaxID=2126350 RepID=UPI003D20DA07